MDQNKNLAELLFPHIDKTPEYYEALYPQRQLPEGARVTRFAPSPTGYLHIGGLFGALVDVLTARSTGGVAYLRIEDTDKKREIDDGVSAIINGFDYFGVAFDEGVTGFGTEKGDYGPYTQSHRAEIYQTVAKSLVEKGLAYPCFCTADELAAIREEQTKGDALIWGYFGKWAKCRDLSLEEIEKNLPEAPDFTGDKGIKLEDVANNRATLAGFTAQLEDIELEALCRGDYVMNSKLGTPGNAAVYGGILKSLRKKGVPPVSATDGPSGIRLHCYASLLPIGTLLASTWNQQLVRELYAVEGAEMARKGSDVLLAPGMNIHRDPLCGRNFEYFSEDPLLAGTMGAAVGIQSQGVSACPKHFACNNQETMRIYNDSRVSERALREIYLKGFEICVKTAHPFNIMTSYNKINGVWGHYHYGTCTQILRGEWEYDGCVMTDWWMRACKDPDFPLLRNNAYRVRGQVDVLMPGAGAGSRKAKYDPTLLESLGKPDGITRAEIFRSAMNTLRFVLRSHPFCAEHGLDNGYRPGPDWFECR